MCFQVFRYSRIDKSSTWFEEDAWNEWDDEFVKKKEKIIRELLSETTTTTTISTTLCVLKLVCQQHFQVDLGELGLFFESKNIYIYLVL